MRGIDLWQSSILRIVDSRNTVSNAAPAAKKWDFCIVWKKWWWEMEGYARAPTGFPSYRARTSPQKLTNCLRGLKNKIRSCIRYEQRCFWNDGIVSNLFHHCSRLYHCRLLRQNILSLKLRILCFNLELHKKYFHNIMTASLMIWLINILRN